MNKPLVSIIINCRNGEKYLKKCIDSILSQNYSNWEIIFWDNNSSDNSSYIFHSYKDKRLNYFFSKNSDTLYAARNKAVEKANGKYIGFLDVDDMWLENNLSKKVEFLEKNNNYKIVYSNYYILNEIKNKNSIFFNFELPSGYITYRLLKKYSIGILSVLIDRDI